MEEEKRKRILGSPLHLYLCLNATLYMTMIHDVGFRVMLMWGTTLALVSQGRVVQCNEWRAREVTRPVWLKDAHN